MITRAVGTEPSVEVETLTVVAAPGDLYLICSDGLTDIVRDGQIAELITGVDNDPDQAAEALVAAANDAVESAQKAAKQATDVAEANFAALSSSVTPKAAPAKARRAA